MKFKCSRSRSYGPAPRGLSMERLEERLALAVQLNYGGPGSVLGLQELVSGATPTVRISEPTPGELRIDLGNVTFDASRPRRRRA